MVEQMKKLSVLVYHREKKAFLDELRDLGVVHVVEKPAVSTDEIQQLNDSVKAGERCLYHLQKTLRTLENEPSQKSDKSPDEVVAAYEQAKAQIDAGETDLANFEKMESELTPWGDFEWKTISKLSDAGISVSFYETSEKKFSLLKLNEVSSQVINRADNKVRFIIFYRGEAPAIDADTVTLPQLSLSEVQAKIAAAKETIVDAEKVVQSLTSYVDLLEAHITQLKSESTYASVSLSFEAGAKGKVLFLRGWLPLSVESKVKQFLDTKSVWYACENPSENDDVPVKLQNAPGFKLFETITKIFSLPDYFELDPTPFFAPFYALFFGLCLGDVGYGAIILIAAGILAAKASGGLKSIALLGVVLGFCTVMAGLFLNTAFGEPMFAVTGAQGGFLKSGALLAFLTPIETEKGTYFPAMPFSMYVGLLQIMLGMGIKAFNLGKIAGPKFIFEPIANIFLVCAAALFLARINFINMGDLVNIGPLLMSVPVSVIYALAGIGAALLFVFVKPDKPVLKGSPAGIPLRFLGRLGFWFLAFYNFITGLMSNGLSYLRLFALGLAGGLLGAAFNQIGLMIITTENGVKWSSPLVLFTILVIILGHVLNFGLGALGSYVHSLRLTFVEFYSCIDFKGGAKPYNPFSKPEIVTNKIHN